jgi:Flp pilus assembly protein TadG
MKNSSLQNGTAGARSPECGQTIVFVLLVLGLFLLAAVGFAVDVSNLWFHKQVAQNAADAACVAGAMDTLVNAQNASTLGGTGFATAVVNATASDCSTNPSWSVCQYAALNGYKGTGLTAGQPSNKVAITFPASVTGATAPPAALAATPFMQVNVVDRTKVFFIGLLSGSRTVDVGAVAACGVVSAQSPIPIVVLNPTAGPSFSVQGTPAVTIVGGPTKGIQVNSSSTSAVNIGGNAAINLSQGGPSNTGSDIGVTGAEADPGATKFLRGTTGHWAAPAATVGDPYARLSAPSVPGSNGTITSAASGVNGCPDPGGCDEYTGGNYPSGITVKNKTAIFDPGVYYVTGGFNMDANSCLRPSSASGNGTGGTIFYLADGNSVTVNANAGKCLGVTLYNTSNLQCPLGAAVPPNIPATVNGNVLLGPCSGTYGDPLGQNHGILFFQNRSKSVSPNFGGGGALLMAGSLYVHQCVTTGSDTGVGCTTSAFNSSVSLGGNSGSATFIIGNIITDKLFLQGTSAITMDLNPNAVSNILKATLLR